MKIFAGGIQRHWKKVNYIKGLDISQMLQPEVVFYVCIFLFIGGILTTVWTRTV